MSTISAGNSTANAIVITGDTTGNVVISTTGGIIDMSGVVGALNHPVGTTAQRPASPVTGAIRYNTTLSQTEVYSGTAWVGLASITYTATYLMVAGGGAGGAGIGASTGGDGGGGGAGNQGTGGTNSSLPGGGGSGIVVLSVPTGNFSNVYSGSNTVVTTSGSNKVITFNASGTYTA